MKVRISKVIEEWDKLEFVQEREAE
jgi:hypothetical protein